MSRVLIVDDDRGIVQSLSLYLGESGFEVFSCMHGNKALDSFHETEPDIVILDINLPGKDGITICRDIRSESIVPILMLSARDQEKDVLSGLENGADDYVSKPFSPREVVARLKTILRRGGAKTADGKYTYKDVEMDENSLEVQRNGEIHQFTKSEFQLLHYILSQEGDIVTRQNLMEEIMGYTNYLYDRTIDTHIKNIRKKIGDDVIMTVRGIGYRGF